MRSDCRGIVPALMIVLALAGGVGAQEPVSADQAQRCAAISEGLRALETSARATVAEVRDQLRKAERDAAWFGAEQFDPYIAALRAQEHQLEATLSTIQTLSCTPPGGAAR
jgi:hypothetical protein